MQLSSKECAACCRQRLETELTLLDVCLDLQPIDGTQDGLCRGQHSVTHDLQARGTPLQGTAAEPGHCASGHRARSAPQVPSGRMGEGVLTMLVMRSTTPSSAPRAQDLVTRRRLIAWLAWKEEPHFWPAMAELHRQPQQQSQESSNLPGRAPGELHGQAQQRGRACGGQRFCWLAVTNGHVQQGTSQPVGLAALPAPVT